ncbi:putative salicylate synthetase [Aspergillus stella-maris]|uniref:putative salicylate synthetase n=1 Tax=Aspergillus stella-maris TaxID=1810926 RepID=UPI003CCDED36
MARPTICSLTLPHHIDSLEATVRLLTQYQDNDYYAYERERTWYIGIGQRAALQIDSTGKQVTIYRGRDDRHSTSIVDRPLSDIARKFVAEYSHSDGDGLIFGYAGYDYAAHLRGEAYLPGQWPLLSLMVPISVVTIGETNIAVTSHDTLKAQDICQFLRSSAFREKQNQHYTLASSSPLSINLEENADEFLSQIRTALARVNSGKYSKVIPSRIVTINGGHVNMPLSLLHGRRSNNPARTFCFSHAGYQSTGFSPEVVAQVKGTKIITDAVAGTRSCSGTPAEVTRLQQDLLNDHKEIYEHTLTVKGALEKLGQICEPGSTRVEVLASVVSRGSVQHLYSRVVGDLCSTKDAWDALPALSPAITGSGIPKRVSLEELRALEPHPRELYMGSVLLIQGNDPIDAANAIRAVFQDGTRTWLQAGAGIVAHSNPERELAETTEKLASVQPYVVGQDTLLQ